MGFTVRKKKNSSYDYFVILTWKRYAFFTNLPKLYYNSISRINVLVWTVLDYYISHLYETNIMISGKQKKRKRRLVKRHKLSIFSKRESLIE